MRPLPPSLPHYLTCDLTGSAAIEKPDVGMGKGCLGWGVVGWYYAMQIAKERDTLSTLQKGCVPPFPFFFSVLRPNHVQHVFSLAQISQEFENLTSIATWTSILTLLLVSGKPWRLAGIFNSAGQRHNDRGEKWGCWEYKHFVQKKNYEEKLCATKVITQYINLTGKMNPPAFLRRSGDTFQLVNYWLLTIWPLTYKPVWGVTCKEHITITCNLLGLSGYLLESSCTLYFIGWQTTHLSAGYKAWLFSSSLPQQAVQCGDSPQPQLLCLTSPEPQ